MPFCGHTKHHPIDRRSRNWKSCNYCRSHHERYGEKNSTDAATIAVIVNGEHALLDCFERRKGCITVGPGKYYGELDFASGHGVGGIWIAFEVPLTHQQVRDHYKIAGSW